MSKISIRDVAKKAGVSVSSVSLAFHKPYQLSSSTRKKILEISEELGYHPNINKVPKIMSAIIIAVPEDGVKKAQSPFVIKLMEELALYNYRATIIYYKTSTDLKLMLKPLETDKNSKGIIIVHNEKSETVFKENNIPTIVVSLHSSYSKGVNIGCEYMSDLITGIKKYYQQGKTKIGVLIEKSVAELEYFQLMKNNIIKQYESVTHQKYSQDMICILDGTSTDYKKIQDYYNKYTPEVWLIVDAYALMVLQFVIQEPIEGFAVIEEGVTCPVQSQYKMIVLERPISQITTLTVEKLFKLIEEQKCSTDEKFLVFAKQIQSR